MVGNKIYKKNYDVRNYFLNLLIIYFFKINLLLTNTKI